MWFKEVTVKVKHRIVIESAIFNFATYSTNAEFYELAISEPVFYFLLKDWNILQSLPIFYSVLFFVLLHSPMFNVSALVQCALL